jgi:hypothetical protein
MRYSLFVLTAIVATGAFVWPDKPRSEHEAAQIIVYYDNMAVDIAEKTKTVKRNSAQSLHGPYGFACGLEAIHKLKNEQRMMIDAALRDIPCDLVQGLRHTKIYDNSDKSRAYAGATQMHFREDLFDLPEARQVIIHEFAHVVDLSGLLPTNYDQVSVYKDGSVPIFTSDPSYDFYRISWATNKRHLKGTTEMDFVTGYAETDPFEDFAESFVFYIEHGNAFREMKKTSTQLQRKYDFLKTEVFGGTEFLTGEKPENLFAREWDSTLIGI